MDATWSPPGDDTLRRVFALLRPLERALDVRLEGAERIPDERPLMFVGNHQLLFVPKGRPHLRFALCEPIPIDHFDGHDPETSVRLLRGEVARSIDAALAGMAG